MSVKIVLLFASCIGFCLGTQIEENPYVKLHNDLLSNYNLSIPPETDVIDILTFRIWINESQLLGANLNNQVMTTNLSLEQNWFDDKLQWNPDDYDGVEMLNVPSEHIWLPDIVHYNNQDDNHEVAPTTQALLIYTGEVTRKSPYMYNLSYQIDVEYFLFNEKTIFVKFGSWTDNGTLVDLKEKLAPYPERKCRIAGVPAGEGYCVFGTDNFTVKIVTLTTMTRKVIIMLFPCIGFIYISILAVYHPKRLCEQILLRLMTLGMIIMIIYSLLKMVPPTYLVNYAIPLFVKLLLFAFILFLLTVMATICVLNVIFLSFSEEPDAKQDWNGAATSPAV